MPFGFIWYSLYTQYIKKKKKSILGRAEVLWISEKFSPSFCACVHWVGSGKGLALLQSVSFIQQEQFDLNQGNSLKNRRNSSLCLSKPKAVSLRLLMTPKHLSPEPSSPSPYSDRCWYTPHDYVHIESHPAFKLTTPSTVLWWKVSICKPIPTCQLSLSNRPQACSDFLPKVK